MRRYYHAAFGGARKLSELEIGESHQRDELIDTDAHLADDRSQSAFCDLGMIRNRDPTVRWSGLSKNDVAAALVIERVADLAQRLNYLTA